MSFFDDIDWFQVREQKRTLDRLINRNSQGDEISQNLIKLEYLLDALQSHAVTVLDLSDRDVYGSETRPSTKLCRGVNCPDLQKDLGHMTGTRCVVVNKIPGNMAECPKGLL